MAKRILWEKMFDPITVALTHALGRRGDDRFDIHHAPFRESIESIADWVDDAVSRIQWEMRHGR